MQYAIARVSSSQDLSKRQWFSKKGDSWSWQEAKNNPDLATAIMKWQLEHHQELRREAVAAQVRV